MAKTGQYDLRITILRRAVGAHQDNGEDAETWPEAGARSYFAARDNLTAGETIVQGIRNSTGSMKLRVKGRAIPVDARDRVKKTATGELFEVTGVYREKGDTVITCDRTRSQTTGQ